MFLWEAYFYGFLLLNVHEEKNEHVQAFTSSSRMIYSMWLLVGIILGHDRLKVDSRKHD